jgi:hypothetical protein
VPVLLVIPSDNRSGWSGVWDVPRLIDAARGRAVAAVNAELIELYWNIGAHISRKVASKG